MEDLLCYATFAEIALDNSRLGVGLAYHVIDRVPSMHHSVTTSGASAQDSLPPPFTAMFYITFNNPERHSYALLSK